MPLTSGTRLGHYDILAPIGSGGMGEVYRGRDIKLNRDVAIKILPEPFAADPDRMARFSREAQVLASLNHPNIATIYGVDERALIMELVDGPMLSERIAQGPMTVDEAMPVIQQLIDALEYAHEKGIIHRDLKPANIKTTPDGRVKVLDFGLAKALSEDSRPSDPASSPTLTMRATMAGVIMGTAAYMSPEQARAHDVDKRADIWAFGVILYEMLTGRQPFAGDTVSDTLAAVLKTDPDWSALPDQTPASIHRLLRRCLERDRKKRLRDIGDARLEIEEALAGSPNGTVRTATPRGVRPRWFGAVATVAIAGVALAFIHLREPASPEPPLMRFQIPVDQSVGRIALSPDGRRLAFIASDAEGRSALWLRSLDSLEIRQLSPADIQSGVFWSPDSRWIGFVSGGKLKKIDFSGAPAQTLCDITGTVPGGAWNREGVILFGSLPSGGGLLRVSQAGGDPVRVTTSDTAHGQTADAWPQFLPDGKHFLFFAYSLNVERTGIQLGSLDGKQPRRLFAAQYGASWVPAGARDRYGHVLFLRDNTLMAQPLDSSFNLTAEAFPIAEHVASTRSYAFFSASETGVLVYRPGAADFGGRQLIWFDRSGKQIATVGSGSGVSSDVALSADGKRIAVSQTTLLPQLGEHPNRDIWLIDQRGMATRFTTDPSPDYSPAWSPDGKRIVFASNRGGPPDIYEKDSQGVESETLLLKSDVAKFPYSISADGRFLLYGLNAPKSRMDLWILPLDGDRKPEPFRATPFNEALGQFSPVATNGRNWIAYTSDESGAFEIYVDSYPQGSGKHLVSKGGGTQARWRADGRELFYIAPGGTLMSVDVRTSPKFESGVPRAMFHTRVNMELGPSGPPGFRYAVTPDGNRFLINSETGAADTKTPLTVVLNWQAGSRLSLNAGR